MLEKDAFFEKYNIDEEWFKSTGFSWRQLVEIFDKYSSEQKRLLPTAKYIADTLQTLERVHSVKYRLKEPEHLIEKIIRKKLEQPSVEITIDNYHDIITDLIGIRAIHVFREDWTCIHDFITSNWELKAKPKVHIKCNGNNEEAIQNYVDNGCEVVNHPFGYRSVHYLINSSVTKESFISEIQVRTIFEEAWSEIDHQIRYPYVKNVPILERYLVIFNGLIENVEEMGSFLKDLKNEIDVNNNEKLKGNVKLTQFFNSKDGSKNVLQNLIEHIRSKNRNNNF